MVLPPKHNPKHVGYKCYIPGKVLVVHQQKKCLCRLNLRPLFC